MPIQSISLGDWLKTTVSRLQGASESPQLDAEILLHTMTGIPRAMAYARPELILTAEQLEDLQLVIDRRARGEPIAYITGTQEFWSMPLKVSPAVLIPRPETELLVERALELLPLEHPAKVLDLGTGSGAIALAIALARPHARVTAIDASHAALSVARDNQLLVGVENLEIHLSDWFSALGGKTFDVIVSNPPYVAANDPDLSPHVAEFEPANAVIAGPNGLEAIERIAAAAPLYLVNGGVLALEHGWRQAAEVRSLLVRAGFSRVRSYRDLAGHERVTEGFFVETRDP
jgi:release factor glutamine methyltransferase